MLNSAFVAAMPYPTKKKTISQSAATTEVILDCSRKTDDERWWVFASLWFLKKITLLHVARGHDGRTCISTIYLVSLFLRASSSSPSQLFRPSLQSFIHRRETFARHRSTHADQKNEHGTTRFQIATSLLLHDVYTDGFKPFRTIFCRTRHGARSRVSTLGIDATRYCHDAGWWNQERIRIIRYQY